MIQISASGVFNKTGGGRVCLEGVRVHMFEFKVCEESEGSSETE